MEVRIWKNGKPVDFTGKNAITALAILLLEKEVRTGIIKSRPERRTLKSNSDSKNLQSVS